jgi:predicted ATPase
MINAPLLGAFFMFSSKITARIKIMLKRIKIQGYKSLVDVEVEFQPLTVLFGPNAAGKSNLLDALQLLSSLATSRNLHDVFASPYRGTVLESFTFGPKGTKGLLEQEKASFSIEADIELSQRTIETTLRRFQLPESVQIEGDQGNNKSLTYSPDIDFSEIKLIKYFIEVEINPKSGFPPRSRQIITWLDAQGLKARGVTIEGTESAFSLSPRLFELVPFVLALREELASWRFFNLEPNERMRQPTPFREAHHIGRTGEDIGPFLNTLRAINERQFKTIGKSLHLLIPEITGIDVSVNDQGNVEVQLMQGETPLPASVLSEGTWRILSLLTLGSIKEPPALLGFEEPEIGINAQRLDLIADVLKNLTYLDIQVIATTHSPTLLDLIPHKSLFVVQQREGKTSINPVTSFYKSPAYAKRRLVSERLLRGDFNVWN